MKKNKNKNGLIELVIPFGNPLEANPKDGLYDDCPHCQRIRKEMEDGLVEKVEVKRDLSSDEAVH